MYSTTCDISANNNVSESTLSDLRRCIANRYQQYNNSSNNTSNVVNSDSSHNNYNVVSEQQQQQTLSSSSVNLPLYANNTSASPTTLSAPLAHLLGN